MAQYLIRIFDHNIRTNYIERRFEADDRLDAVEKIKVDEDVLREAKGKLSTSNSLSQAIDNGSYELVEL